MNSETDLLEALAKSFYEECQKQNNKILALEEKVKYMMETYDSKRTMEGGDNSPN